ncbi:MAG: hypothetical protein LT106_18760 [Burkholderiaceae bacterium]|nr:hypothetical protein [Burkholderiaceae bacterium]
MDPAEKASRFEHRRQRLAELLDALWPAPRAWFAAAIRRSESYVARLLLPADDPHRKNIGDAIMSAATSALDLDPGWFDQPLGSSIPEGLALDDKGLVRQPSAGARSTRTTDLTRPAESTSTLSPAERRLLDAFHLLPDDEQDELLRDLGRRAERYRVFAERLMRGRGHPATDEPEPLPSNVRAPHFSSTRGRLIEPPRKPRGKKSRGAE